MEKIVRGQVAQFSDMFVLFELSGTPHVRERVAHHGKCFATSGLPMHKDTGPSSLEKSRYQTLDGILIDSKIVSVFIKNIIKTKWEINSGFGLINQNLSKCVTSGDE